MFILTQHEKSMIEMKIALTGFMNSNFTEFLIKNYKCDFINVYQMTDFSILNDYDIIFYYVITGLETKIPLVELSGEIKKQCPNKPIIGFFDYEADKGYDNEWFATMRDMDKILHVGPINHYVGWQNSNIKNKSIFFPIPQNLEPIEPKLNSEKKWVAIMRHTSPISEMGFALKMLAECNFPVKWFTGWDGTNITQQERIAKELGVQDIKIFNRLNWDDYKRELSECYIGLDNVFGYIGWSRFITECAMFSIPVISNDYCSSNFIANPNLRFTSEGPMKHMLTTLYKNQHERDMYGIDAQRSLIKYLSFEASKIRFDNIINEVIKK